MTGRIRYFSKQEENGDTYGHREDSRRVRRLQSLSIIMVREDMLETVGLTGLTTL
ncbi:MAG: hypothetical protein ACUVV4_08780 [Candidatus Bathyarchaeia archaeon]